MFCASPLGLAGTDPLCWMLGFRVFCPSPLGLAGTEPLGFRVLCYGPGERGNRFTSTVYEGRHSNTSIWAGFKCSVIVPVKG